MLRSVAQPGALPITAQRTIAVSEDEPGVLPITGQGTIAVQAMAEAGLSIAVDGADGRTLVLYLTGDSWNLFAAPTGSEKTRAAWVPIPARATKGDKAAYLVPNVKTTYWLSIDNRNGILRCGLIYRPRHCSSTNTFLQIRQVLPERKPYVGRGSPQGQEQGGNHGLDRQRRWKEALGLRMARQPQEFPSQAGQ